MSLEPRWIIPVGAGCSLGVTIDDGCYVVLFPKLTDTLDSNKWKPGAWIPSDVARFLGILAFLGTIKKEEEDLRVEHTRIQNNNFGCPDGLNEAPQIAQEGENNNV